MKLSTKTLEIVDAIDRLNVLIDWSEVDPDGLPDALAADRALDAGDIDADAWCRAWLRVGVKERGL